MKKRKLHKPEAPVVNVKYLLAGGSMLALVGALIDVRDVVGPAQAPPPNNSCLESVDKAATLSRDELAQLLTIPERDRRDAVKLVIGEPQCRLSSVEIRAGVQAERDAYPLEFDPQTWFVVLYEGDEYAGYDFVFQQP